MKDKYMYPAVFNYAEDGINISFPDLPGAFSCAETTEEALKMAKECLELHLFGMVKDEEEIPTPSRVEAKSKNETVVLIEAYMPTMRMAQENKSVQKMVSLPNWLANISKEQKINLSQTLQAALLTQLGMTSIAIPHKKKSKIS